MTGHPSAQWRTAATLQPLLDDMWMLLSVMQRNEGIRLVRPYVAVRKGNTSAGGSVGFRYFVTPDTLAPVVESIELAGMV